jgi:hypothetical protein
MQRSPSTNDVACHALQIAACLTASHATLGSAHNDGNARMAETAPTPAPAGQTRDMPVRGPQVRAARSADWMFQPFGYESIYATNKDDALRFGNWGWVWSGPNDNSLTYLRDRNRVREESITNPYVKHAIQELVDNICGEQGFDPYISQLPILSKRWKRWKKECDPRKEFNWNGLIRLRGAARATAHSWSVSASGSMTSAGRALA